MRGGLELADVELREAKNQPEGPGSRGGNVGCRSDAMDGAPAKGATRGKRDIEEHGILRRNGAAFHVSLPNLDDGTPAVKRDGFGLDPRKMRCRNIQKAMHGLAFSVFFCPLCCCRHIFVPFAKLVDRGAFFNLPFG